MKRTEHGVNSGKGCTNRNWSTFQEEGETCAEDQGGMDELEEVKWETFQRRIQEGEHSVLFTLLLLSF